ncbi:MAG TPA: rhodanese-like domain-containing protein [Pyrinomonadaceae bacterium]|jgi:thiosulfate/3-mercaptopyruvate sulfurtransferase
MKFTAIVCILILLLIPVEAKQQGCGFGDGNAAGAETPLTVSVEWLEKNLSSPQMVLLHVGAKDEYDAGHIAGARYITLQDISTTAEESDLALQLPSAERLKAALEKFGISNDSRIIVYFGKDWVSPTTRVYYTLDYAGLGKNTSILDGGMPAWTAAGKTLTKDIPAPKQGVLKIQTNDSVLAKIDFVKSNLNKDTVKIIDARTPNFWDGSTAGGQPRSGRIPGAKNIPFSTITDEKGFLKDEATLRKMFADAGVKPYDTVVAYCHIGQQGSLAYFAAKSLGYKVKLYDGSFQEWSRTTDLPVEAPKASQEKASVTVVTPQWAEEHSADANLRILDVRLNVYDYFAGHVPNAVHLADAALRFPSEGYPTQYGETFLTGMVFARSGIKKTDKVLVYSDGDGVLGATMIAYLLERVGHTNILFVDGGWRDYKAAQKSAQEYPAYKPAGYDVLDNRGVRVTLDDVKNSIGKDGVKFIDARPPEVYRGETKIWTRNGHIPGAVNIPWKLLVEENNTHKFKSVEDMRKVYLERGIRETDDIIVYCGTSREASLEYMVLKHILKFPKVRLYEGSWAEYSNHPQMQVETGAGK